MGISIHFAWQQEPAAGQQKQLRTRRHRTHRYKDGQRGSEFFLEDSSNLPISYMTAQGAGVRQGDYIDIETSTGHLTFQVSEVEYYSNPADMWMAQLHEVAA